ncbi:hypothetical protein KIM372_14970 [Bombiscardovia nodaiensis]|uniref:Fimbrial subunit FimA n=1 Tax=Bombiscardovia nodaiensis TaxID=2932181 RepID=A0ABM8B9N1_9BIFI|nr:hypothetical protein KIM372_14970 [Bombiscardovia nodaiensis]
MSNSSIRSKAVASIACIATALGLLAWSVSARPAQADDSVVDVSASSGSITVQGKGSSMNGHTFSAVQIGEYVDATADTTANPAVLTSVSVGTAPAIKTAAQAALTAAGQTSVNDAYAGNPVGQAAALWLGFESTTPHAPTGDITSNSQSKAWAGHLRDFVTALAAHADFATALAGLPAAQKNQAAATVAADADASVTFSGLAQGLYVVIDTTARGNTTDQAQRDTMSIPMLVGTAVGGYTKFKGETAPNSDLGVIKLKNNVPTISKEIVLAAGQDASVSIGDFVHYRITASVPLTTGFSSYTYKMVDTPDSSLTPLAPDTTGKELSVSVGSSYGSGATAVAANLYSASVASGALTVDFTGISDPAFAFGKNIYVDYWMQVNLAATAGKLSNNLSVVYSNDPQNPTTTATAKAASVSVYTYAFSLIKKAKVDQAVLTGAKFSLSKDGRALTFTQVKDASNNPIPGSYKLAQDQASGTTEIEVSSDASPTAVVPKGQLHIDGLGTGTYTVSESTAPQGYSQTFKPSYKEVVGLGGAGHDDLTNPVFSNGRDGWGLVAQAAAAPGSSSNHYESDGAVVVNNVTSISQLPATGGAGIILALIIALVLALAGTVLMILRRRRKPMSR